jgi:glycerol uptake facilitator-like aquaporin
MFYGALVEGMLSFVSRIVALESGHWSQRVSEWANSLTTVALCIYGLDTTGGFFNPILASALTLNCEGNNIIQHVFVYWLGALTGGIIARTAHIFLRPVPKEKEE